MTFASFDDYMNSSKGGSRSIGFVFYTLGLGSKSRRSFYPPFKGKIKKVINGKEREVMVHTGHSATGYLLADEKTAASSIIKIHSVNEDTLTAEEKKKQQPPALCRKSIDSNARCPICDQYKAAKDAGTKKEYKYRSATDRIYLPFVALDFEDDHEIMYNKETGEPTKDVFPIYWFSFEVTNYKAEKFQNLNRIIEHIRTPGSNDYATKIIAPIPPDRTTQEYHYELTNDQPDLPDDVWNHPLFEDGYIITTEDGGFEFTPEYRKLIRNLALLQPVRAVNPVTGEVLTYVDENGRDVLEEAEDFVNGVMEESQGEWKAYTKIGGDDNEEDIPS